MNLINNLIELGLNKNEATVYTSLLQFDLTNVGPIVKQTGLHRQLVYEALSNLEKKGLATSVIKNGRKHFQASSPTTIIRQMEKKEELANQIVPDLFKLQSGSLDKIEVKTLYGQGGFFDNLKELIDSAGQADGTMRIIGGAKDTAFYHMIGKRYKTYVALLKKHSVKKYLIAPEHSSEEFKKKFAGEAGNILKTMKVGLSSPTYTRITPEMISIEIYSGGQEITIIQIKNKAIAKGYLEHFELLWEQANT